MMRSTLNRFLFVASGCLLQACSFAQKSSLSENYDAIVHNVAKMVEVVHYSEPKYDDSFSWKLFDSYFENLDPSKMHFVRSDLDAFASYRNKLDEEIRGGKVNFFKRVDTLYLRRLKESRQLMEEFLASPLKLKQAGTYNADRDSLAFVSSLPEKKKLWLSYITYLVVNQYVELTDATKDSISVTIDTALERKARENVLRIQRRGFDRLEKEAVTEENFGKYLNSMIHLMDPHSNYFLPVEKREFQEDLSGIYYGIGALLQDNDGKIGVAELMIGGPAWRSGLVEKGDVIIEVAQENGTPQNVEGFGMSEIIKLTRGKKGSSVTITFRKADGKLKKVTLHRDALQLEDTFVRSAIIEDSVRIGYIYLPKFYTSFDEQNGRSCARDIEKELRKLSTENIQGVIIDVRDNGGGSLEEVIKMVGLFIKEGPVVQVKARGKAPEIARIDNKELLYGGPVVVLVNELSASASEIFAAAMQDYRRGVIVGSPSFGKGTVQRGFRVPGKGWEQSDSDLGTVHLTLQKYYRVNGDATQLKGIQPDIVLPGLYEYYKVQERNYPNALPWDEIGSAGYQAPRDTGFLRTLQLRSQERLQSGIAFNEIQRGLRDLSAFGNNYTLDVNTYRGERKKIREAISRVRSSASMEKEMNVSNTTQDSLAIAKREQFRIDNNNAWLKRLKKDLYLNEAVFVMKDLIQVKNS